MFATARRARERRRNPPVQNRVVPASRIDGALRSPDHHLRSGPDGGVSVARRGSVRGRCGGPRVGRRIVSTTRVEADVGVRLPSPDDHLAAGPDGRMVETSRRCVDRRKGGPNVRDRIVRPSQIHGRAARRAIESPPRSTSRNLYRRPFPPVWAVEPRSKRWTSKCPPQDRTGRCKEYRPPRQP